VRSVEKAQAEIVKNTVTPPPIIVKNTQTDDNADTNNDTPVATDPAHVQYAEVVSREDAITKELLEVVKRDVTTPIREGRRHEATDNYQKIREEQIDAIRKKGGAL
jgi:hypothetical protein